MSRTCRKRGHREKRNAYKILVGKPEGNRPIARHRCRWEDNTRLDLTEIRWEVMG
jgi:hypothetical protein